MAEPRAAFAHWVVLSTSFNNITHVDDDVSLRSERRHSEKQFALLIERTRDELKLSREMSFSIEARLESGIPCVVVSGVGASSAKSCADRWILDAQSFVTYGVLYPSRLARILRSASASPRVAKRPTRTRYQVCPSRSVSTI